MRCSIHIVSSLFLIIGMTAPALAATVSLYDGKPDLVTKNTVGVAGYRMSNEDWDQMLGNGSVKNSPKDLTTAKLGSARELNGVTWDFSVSYESGDTAARGFTFSMSQRDYEQSVGAVNTLTGRSRSIKPFESTLLFDEKNPLNDGFPLDAFNAINFEARAGGLRDDISKALLEVSKLNFYVGNETTSNKDLSTFDWRLSGIVQGRFSCAHGTDGCFRDDSINMNMRFAEVDAVPVPAAAWLLLSALGALLGLKLKHAP